MRRNPKDNQQAPQTLVREILATKQATPTWQAASRKVLETFALVSLALGSTAFQCALKIPSDSRSTGQLPNLATKYPDSAGRSTSAVRMRSETGTGNAVLERVGGSDKQQVDASGAHDVMESLDSMLSSFPPEGIKVPASHAEGLMKLVDNVRPHDSDSDGKHNMQKEELLKLERVLDTLKASIPLMLHEEPEWDIFTKDFEVNDHTHTHTKLQGLEANQLLWQLLHRTCKEMIARDDVHVEDDHKIIVTPGTVALASPLLLVAGAEVKAQWKVVLEFVKNPFLSFLGLPRDYSRLDIELHAVFHLNHRQQVDSVQIDKWLANGRQIQSWPKVQLIDDHVHNLKRIRDWADTMQEWQPVNVGLQRFRRMKTSSLGFPRTAESSLVGHHAPDFEIELIGGEKRMLSAVIAEGKPIVIDFYMNFCPSCSRAAKEIDALAANEKYEGKVNFLLMNLGSITEADTYRELHGLSGSCLHGSASRGTVAAYSVKKIPHKTIIGQDGTVFKNEGVQFTDVDALL